MRKNAIFDRYPDIKKPLTSGQILAEFLLTCGQLASYNRIFDQRSVGRWLCPWSSLPLLWFIPSPSTGLINSQYRVNKGLINSRHGVDQQKNCGVNLIIIGVNLLILEVHDQIVVLPSLFAVHPHIFCFCGFSVCVFAVFSIFCYADLVSFFLLLILAIHPGFSFSAFPDRSRQLAEK